jgi:hypothetical protein
MTDNNNIRFHIAIIGVFAAAMLAIVVFMSMNASAVITGDAYSGYGDWVINNPTWVIDDSVTVYDGDIICNANFHVWNSEIMELMMDWDYHTIIVNNGVTLNTNESNVESYWDYFNLDVKGTLLSRNTDYNWLNWTSISGSAVTNDTHLYYVIGGLQMDGPVKWDNGTIMYVYGGFNITDKASFYSTQITRSYDGMIVSGTATFEAGRLEYIYNSFNVTGSCTMIGMYVYRIYDGMNLMGTTNIRDSRLEYIYLFNASATVTVYNTTHYRIYNGLMLTGPVSIELCDYMYTYVRIYVSNDRVVVKDTTFRYMYDMGFYFDNCDATLNNVTIDVFSGTARGYWKTDHTGDWDERAGRQDLRHCDGRCSAYRL